jgi:hypothetical protein
VAKDRAHPYSLEEDEELRSRGRRWLRELDDLVVERAIAGWADVPTPAGIDRLLAEKSLREWGDSVISELPEGALGSVRGRDILNLHAVLGQAQGQWDHERPDADVFPLWELVRKTEMGVEELSRRPILRHDSWNIVVAVVAALVLADELLDDDYRDPRVEARWGRRQRSGGQSLEGGEGRPTDAGEQSRPIYQAGLELLKAAWARNPLTGAWMVVRRCARRPG